MKKKEITIMLTMAFFVGAIGIWYYKKNHCSAYKCTTIKKGYKEVSVIDDDSTIVTTYPLSQIKADSETSSSNEGLSKPKESPKLNVTIEKANGRNIIKF